MKYLIFKSLFIGAMASFLAVSCNEKNETQKESIPEAKSIARVIFKTQDAPFILSQKSEIKNDYKSQENLTVPQDLAPQNKWVMFEGPVLENELIAYRLYMDSRHRFDIYGKKTNSMVMDTVGWNYHEIMDWGSDILKVGESLGIGSPAIWYSDSLYTLSNCSKKSIQVIKKEGDVASVIFTFKDLLIGDQKITLTHLWSLGTSNPHSTVELKVIEGKLPEGAKFATGIVKHLPDVESGIEKDKFFLFNWGKQSFHKQNMGMGIVADTVFNPMIQANSLNHLVVFQNSKQGVKYQFAAAWEQDVMNVKERAKFKNLLIGPVHK